MKNTRIKKKKKDKGITLVALVITIIVLLLLAGISIMGLAGKDGLIGRTQKAKIKTQLANAKEETSLAISALIAENVGNMNAIKPKMIAEQINKDNNKSTYAEDENNFPTNIIYSKKDTEIGEEIQVKIGNNLEIIDVKTESGITNDNPNIENNGNSNNENVTNVGNVNVKIIDVKSNGFTINVEPDNVDNIAIYQYYVDGKMIYEGKEKQYVVNNLKPGMNCQVEVKVIPRTVVSIKSMQQKTLDAPTIELANKYDKYIYIDANNGNDTNGDGSREKPYATLDKIANSGIIENGYSYGIILRDGTYSLTNNIVTLSTNSDLNIIGNKQNTKLYSELECGTGSGIGSENYKINFYRLVLEDNSYQPYEIFIKNPISFYNVVFNYEYNPGYGYILPGNYENEMKNCTIVNGQKFLTLQLGEKTMKLTNCYGKILSGYITEEKDWNYQTNYITSTPNLDSATYSIKDDESVWKNKGTGENPDKTQANLGVYGGTYSWEFDTDIN